jgi:hypothetical protein
LQFVVSSNIGNDISHTLKFRLQSYPQQLE